MSAKIRSVTRLAMAAQRLLAPSPAALAPSAALSAPSSLSASSPLLRLSRGHVALPRLSLAGPAQGSSSARFGQAAPPQGLHVSPRHFASKAASDDSSLVRSLEDEVEHEKRTYQAPPDVASGPPAPFRVESTPGAAELVLRATYQGEDIQVLVSQAEEEEDPADDLDYDEGAGEDKAEAHAEAEEDDEEEEYPEPYIPVRVSVTKKAADGTLQVLEFDMGIEGEESDWVIEGVRLESPGVGADSVAYSGPDYGTLDPALQEQFEGYLERRGFTSELGGFIRSCLDDKEQQEYVSWLQRVSTFVALKSA